MGLGPSPLHPGISDATQVEVRRGKAVKPVRRYEVAVEPNGHTRKAKDLLRAAGKPRSSVDSDLEQASLHTNVRGDRFLSRHGRVKRFVVGRHFPALVATPEVVAAEHSSGVAQGRPDPQAHAEATGGAESSREPRSRPGGDGETLRPWLVSGVAGAGGAISDRRPAYFVEHYDSLQARQRAEYSEAKERWVGESTILPTSRSVSAGPAFETGGDMGMHIAELRDRGRSLKGSLEERYMAKRRHFQREQVERGGLSTFQRYEADLEATALEEANRASAEPAEPKPNEGPDLGTLKNLMSIRKSSMHPAPLH